MSYKYEFFLYVVMRFLLAREYLLLPERMRQCCNKLNLLRTWCNTMLALLCAKLRNGPLQMSLMMVHCLALALCHNETWVFIEILSCEVWLSLQDDLFQWLIVNDTRALATWMVYEAAPIRSLLDMNVQKFQNIVMKDSLLMTQSI